MKRILLLLTVAVAAVSMLAAPVDQAAAARKAQTYLANEMYSGRQMAPAALTPVLVMSDIGSKRANNPAYYVFNTATTFVVVSGDDRAEEILMVGDEPLNMERIPDALLYLLDCYKEQITYLQEHPDIQVERPSERRGSMRAVTYGPLLTAKWDQSAPYWNQCKFTYNGTTYQCLTGCPATSASMVLYYWKYPTTQVPAIASYTSILELSTTQKVYNYTYPAVSATTFDWASMKDTYYYSSSGASATAVATLMRYVGQAERMMYGTEAAGGSGIYHSNASVISTMFKNMGYESTARVAQKYSYSSDNWNNLIIAEMAASRPVVYMAQGDDGEGGHAFNVDGYRESDGKFHVNFGWSGYGNSWYAMDAFTYSGTTFNVSQLAIVGVQPPGGIGNSPYMNVDPTSVTFTGEVGGTYTETFIVTGGNLQSNVTIGKAGSSAFTISPATLTPAQVAAGATVTVTYTPGSAGNHSATLTVSTANVTSKLVSVSGTATGTTPTNTPTMNVNPSSLDFDTEVGTPVQKKFTVTGANLTDKVYLTVTGTGYDIDKKSLTKASVVNSPNGVDVTVTYNPTEAGSHPGMVTLTTAGGEDKAVILNGTATEPAREINVSPELLEFNTTTGEMQTKTFTVVGTNLTGNLSLSLNNANGAYTITPTSITKAQAEAGATVTVKYNPSAAGTHEATVTISGGDADSKMVTLIGTATDPVRTITVDPSSLTFNNLVGETATKTFTVTGENLTGGINLALNDAAGVYSVTPTSLTKAQAEAGVTVSVTYNPNTFGAHPATITLTGGGAEPVTVSLNGLASLIKYNPVMLPANEEHIDLTKFRADWTDETPEANVSSYTLEVTPKVVEPVLLGSLSGSDYPANGYGSITLSAPWGSTTAMGGKNAIYFMRSGSITYTIPDGYTNATFTVKITTKDGNVGTGNVTVATPQTAAVGHNFAQNETFYWLVTASSGEKITITTTDSYSPDMVLIAVYSGDANSRLITGITDMFYTVNDLAEAGTFLYRVKALYIDDTESEWSNIEEVTLFQNTSYLRGDVNGDGAVDITDATTLINYLLSGDSTGLNLENANCDLTGTVDITDATTLINYLLNGAW
ncbi:MAG: C10 family peptidase [Muribaculaceae bacterium]|nr:C10 family peptidase [Muribaculaceae bacterium]